MKKLSVLIITALLFANLCPVQAGVLSEQKAKIERNKIYKSTYDDIKSVINQQTIFTNKYDLDGLATLYTKDFVNSDGFNKEVYFDLIKDTWKTYPDIVYKSSVTIMQLFLWMKQLLLRHWKKSSQIMRMLIIIL